MKDDTSLSSTLSSSIHSGTEAFELLLLDDDDYLHMKPPPVTDFTEKLAEDHTAYTS